MMKRIIIETDECELNMLSKAWFETIIIYISNEQFGNAGEIILNNMEKDISVPFTICELLVKDWDKYLTPWKADANMSGRVFSGRAEVLLTILEEKIIPMIRENVVKPKIYIAGYSLAGLFALWSLYESSVFDGAACCSGSVWYPGWTEYALQRKLDHNCRVYLSLGKKEKNARHVLMRDVEKNMIKLHELLMQDDYAICVHMDWHEGGHFQNPEKRTEEGIKWLVIGESE